MAVIYLSLVLILVHLFEGNCKSHEILEANISRYKEHQSMKYITKSNHEVIVRVMMHLDKAMTKQVPKSRAIGVKRINFKPKALLREVEKVFASKSLNQKIRLKLVNLKVLNNATGVAIDENVSVYLKNYCEWQKYKKIRHNDLYFSVLLTGLDIYYINNSGQKVRGSTGRGYMSKMCSVDKSCAVVKWHPKDVVYLLAHEIAHSLGVYHDGTRNHCQSYGFIMASHYNRQRTPRHWSPCTKMHLDEFIRKKHKSWCVLP